AGLVPGVGPREAWGFAPAAQFRFRCWEDGSFGRNRVDGGRWPDCGAGTTSGSLTPSEETLDAVDPVALPPPSEGGAIGPVAVAPVVAVGVVSAAFAFDWWSIFIVRGTWNASTPSRITPPTAAMIFCRLAFALGSN